MAAKKTPATRPVGRPLKFAAGAVRLPVSVSPDDAAEVQQFVLWFSAREGRRLSVGDAVLLGLRDSALWKAFKKSGG